MLSLNMPVAHIPCHAWKVLPTSAWGWCEMAHSATYQQDSAQGHSIPWGTLTHRMGWPSLCSRPLSLHFALTYITATISLRLSSWRIAIVPRSSPLPRLIERLVYEVTGEQHLSKEELFSKNKNVYRSSLFFLIANLNIYLKLQQSFFISLSLRHLYFWLTC